MYTPSTQKGIFGNLLLWVVAVFLVGVVLTLVGWRVGWWMNAKATNYQAHILRNSYANQQTLRDQITSQISNLLTISTQVTETKGSEQQALKAQRFAVLGIICQDASQVTGDPLPVDQAQFVQSNCLDGAANPSSTYGN